MSPFLLLFPYLLIERSTSLLTGNCTALITAYGFDSISLEVTDINGVNHVSATPIIPMPTMGDPWYLTTILDPLDPNTLLSFHLLHAWIITQPNFIATIEVNCTDNNGSTSGPCLYSTGPINGFPYGPWSVFDPTPSGVYLIQSYTPQSAITIANNINYTTMDPNAVWVSNGEQFDQIDFIFDFSAISCDPPPTTPAPTTEPDDNNCTAKVCAHGDDSITLDVSYDSGSTWNVGVASETNWQNTMNFNVNPVDSNTILRFTVVDNGGFGGFLATIELCGNNDYVWSFFTDEINTYFDVISDSSNDPLLDAFNAFGTGPWQVFVNENNVQCMNRDADWVWNSHNGNTMVFELDFGHQLDVLKRLECVEDVIPMDCCQYSVEEYLDTCYCDVDATPTAAPTPATAPIHVATAVDIREVRANGERVAMNVIGDVKDGMRRNNDDGLLYVKMNKIEYMIYTTWLLMMVQFVGFVFVIINSKSCCSRNDERVKEVNGRDTEF